MQLFHYSDQKFNILKTLEKQKIIPREEVEKEKKSSLEMYKKSGIHLPGFYYEHISFFFEPPPLDIISEIFPPDHTVWFKGNELYQYTVESNLIGSFQYVVVEFPEKTDIFYDDSLSLSQYYDRLKKQTIANNYIGPDNRSLELSSSKFIGTTRELFRKIKERPNYEDIKYKYAATVPHVMIYPTRGVIKYQKVEKVTCG